MDLSYPRFTPEMKKTHTILIPNMAITQFRLLNYALTRGGYHCEILGNCGSEVAQLGLKYVHNDTCYPALLVIGQFIDALNSGKYDLQHTALLISQTGGGCRASNYIHLLRKALKKAGYGYIPVASLNFSGLEKDSGFQMTLPLARSALASVFYGDLLCALRNQTAPYETEPCAADRLLDAWVDRLGSLLLAGKGYTAREMKALFPRIAAEFAALPVDRVPKVKVGVVGEIYVKYSPLGNNDLQKFLERQGCEVNFPGLMGFVQYCIFNMGEDHVLYGGAGGIKIGTDLLLRYLDGIERAMLKAEREAGFYAPGPFSELIHKPEGIVSMGAKMGEGWLLPAEMVELVQGGYGNIVCAQPFGCLPNHIVGKGVINRIRALYPAANITPIDYDPSATRVNQENRIKLMLAVGKERLEGNQPAPQALTAEQLAGGPPVIGREPANV
jgi:predicted nucleotide-binding protein (sugar kinase/HSP70/actin superfamily)